MSDPYKKIRDEYIEDMARARVVDAAAMAEKEARDARAELRDRFAVEALKTLMPHAEVPNPVTARKAWQWADMMIATREMGGEMGVIRKEDPHPAPVEPTALVRHPSLINPAVPTRVMVLLDNTRLPENTPVLPDGTYVLKDCVVIGKHR